MKCLLLFLCLAISVSIPEGLALLLRPLHIPCALFLVILDFGKHEHSIYPGLDQLHPPPGSLPSFTPPAPTVFLPGESQGRGSLLGCGLWGRTESDTTEAT